MRAGYTFTGTWTVDAAPAAVRDVLADVEHYPDWWPQILAVAYLGLDDGRVLCRSRLPYTLDLTLHASVREDDLLEVAVDGALHGWVRWRLSPAPEGTTLRFEQQVEVRGLLAVASTVAGPLLRWNHEQMMRGCLEGLHERLA